MSDHPHTPADVLAEALVQGGHGVRPSSTSTPTWPVFVGHLLNKPDNAVCVYDTNGRSDGRIQRTGRTVRKPGWQVRVRSRTRQVGIVKIKAIQKYLDSVRKMPIIIGTDRYTIGSVTQTSDILPLGREPGTAVRDSFTLNGTITLKEIDS